MSNIVEIQNEIIEEFSFYHDWSDKYEYIIELGKDLEGLEDSLKTEENIIKGCQSQVWFTAIKNGNNIEFKADSDAIIVKGLVALLLRVYNNQPIEDILKEDLFFISEIGMQNHLSPTRSNGLLAMVKQIKFYALAFNAKN